MTQIPGTDNQTPSPEESPSIEIIPPEVPRTQEIKVNGEILTLHLLRDKQGKALIHGISKLGTREITDFIVWYSGTTDEGNLFFMQVTPTPLLNPSIMKYNLRVFTAIADSIKEVNDPTKKVVIYGEIKLNSISFEGILKTGESVSTHLDTIKTLFGNIRKLTDNPIDVLVHLIPPRNWFAGRSMEYVFNAFITATGNNLHGLATLKSVPVKGNITYIDPVE